MSSGRSPELFSAFPRDRIDRLGGGDFSPLEELSGIFTSLSSESSESSFFELLASAGSLFRFLASPAESEDPLFRFGGSGLVFAGESGSDFAGDSGSDFAGESGSDFAGDSGSDFAGDSGSVFAGDSLGSDLNRKPT